MRSIVRELALRILFEAEVGKFNIEKVLERYISACSIKSISDFVQELINTVAGNKKEIDGIIQQHAIGWKLERMGSVDRNILRLAIAEMVYLESIPISASINEAIELGKMYGDEQSARFLNGILGAVSKMLENKDTSC